MNSIASALQLGATIGQAGLSGVRQISRAVRRPRNATRTRKTGTHTFVRNSNAFSITLVAGEYNGNLNPTLASAITTDVASMYDMYKMNWVELIIMPRLDPANGSVTNNFPVFIAACCDPTGQLVGTPSIAQITAFANHKFDTLTTGKVFKYRFSPKFTDAVASGNLAVNTSDWLIASTVGLSVPHASVVFNLKTVGLSVQSYDCMFRFCFTAKGES